MSTPTIRLDRSKSWSEVRGDRHPKDPLYGVHFCQDGLYFDVHGVLVKDNGQTEPFTVNHEGQTLIMHPLYTDAMRDKVKARLARAVKKTKPGEAASKVDVDAQIEDVNQEVNLEAWLRGEMEFAPAELFTAALTRFSKRYTSLRQLIEDLVLDEQLVPQDEVAPALLKVISGK